MIPIRLQLLRVKGFDLQALSLATNGLPAKSVRRPSKFGNPYRIVRHSGAWWVIGHTAPLGPFSEREATECAVMYYAERVVFLRDFQAMARELVGFNLACSCPLVWPDGTHRPCHVDPLLHLTTNFLEPLSVASGQDSG